MGALDAFFLGLVLGNLSVVAVVVGVFAFVRRATRVMQ